MRSRGIMSLSRRDMDDVYGSLRDQNAWMQARRDPNRTSYAERAAGFAEVLGGSMAVGYLAGRLGTGNIPNTSIPLGLAAGAAIHLAAAFLPLGKMADHLAQVGNGAAAGWGSMWAAGLGQKQRADAAAAPAAPAAATMGIAGRRQFAPRARPLTEAEMAGMAQRASRVG